MYRVVEEFEWADEATKTAGRTEDEELIEISLNYFAQNARDGVLLR